MQNGRGSGSPCQRSRNRYHCDRTHGRQQSIEAPAQAAADSVAKGFELMTIRAVHFKPRKSVARYLYNPTVCRAY